MITKFYFVRHAEAQGNVKRLFHGWTDSNITENGHLQSQNIADRLSQMAVDLIISSPLRRTMQTAAYISSSLQLPIQEMETFKEINGGDWENQPFEVLPRLWPKAYQTWNETPHLHQMPKGESIIAFQSRLIQAMDNLLANYGGQNICVVTHGTALKVLMCYFKGISLSQMTSIPWYENTALSLIEVSQGSFRILLEGDYAHLPDALTTVNKKRG